MIITNVVQFGKEIVKAKREQEIDAICNGRSFEEEIDLPRRVILYSEDYRETAPRTIYKDLRYNESTKPTYRTYKWYTS